MPKKVTTEEFINRSSKIHNGYYDYSLVNYIHSTVSVDIICPKHGLFKQTPHSHMSGRCCKKCSYENSTKLRSSDTEQFIIKANTKHQNKYDYSLVNYINNHTNIKIICPIHGEYEQKPDTHLNSGGCRRCGNEISKLSRLSNTEEFIKKAKLVHTDCKYSYESVDYKNNRKKVQIECLEHGTFLQTPADHLSGYGCDLCGRIRTINSLYDTQEDFINKAKTKHLNKYSYDKVIYTLSINKVIIICPTHGEFTQKPYVHLNGRGCPKCKQSFGERSIQLQLDKLNIKYETEKRFNSCRSKYPLPFDFFVEDKYLIEYDGQQHFEPHPKYGIESFIKLQDRDKIKTQWAKDNGYFLIRIPYTQLKQIPEIIQTLFANRNF